MWNDVKYCLTVQCDTLYLVEECLFFRHYNFHKQKIAFHRASMKFYERSLLDRGIRVVYIDSFSALADVRALIPHLRSIGAATIHNIDTTDCWLERRIREACIASKVELIQHVSPLFMNTNEENTAFVRDRERLHHADFYKKQRIQKNVLLEGERNPTGGRWTFDDENRRKYPKGLQPPRVTVIPLSDFHGEAATYTDENYPNNVGMQNIRTSYPVTFQASKHWLNEFFECRFKDFGAYEDAILSQEGVLHHSVLSPLLNVGLLTPQYVIEHSLRYANANGIPMNSVEGFVRQILGWREFVRAVYEAQGSRQRTTNYWGFTRKIPPSFWDGTTGIEPIDSTIRKVLSTGYCHHIERLMVLGNFMLLCEFDPDEVYRWFMEMFIDAYDWVMVPNVYGMSQFADGGLMTTKPYISGSNYLMKMSDYRKGEWQTVWDGLFWRFMHVHRDFFTLNPRLRMLVRSFDKMPSEKQQKHCDIADEYLSSLSTSTS
ncbi:MAG: cryptochrome/photolyase family protein [Candidatus Kapabacteria bacterium]|nr:cryptochrome/photolyase family protein [Candidatus Kapabacteria bacterium]